MVGFYAREQQTRIDLNLDAELPMVEVDPIQIQQVLVNLIRNAIDAMRTIDPHERWVQIATQTDINGGVEIQVSDVGPGVAEKDFEKLFDHFFTTKAEGMGMGLAISRGIVELHGGSLIAERREPAGMIFRVRLSKHPIRTERKAKGYDYVI